jgi:ribosomal protein S4
MKLTSHKGIPAWLEVEPERLSAKVIREPTRSDVPYPIEEDKIVAFYSK